MDDKDHFVIESVIEELALAFVISSLFIFFMGFWLGGYFEKNIPEEIDVSLNYEVHTMIPAGKCIDLPVEPFNMKVESILVGGVTKRLSVNELLMLQSKHIKRLCADEKLPYIILSWNRIHENKIKGVN